MQTNINDVAQQANVSIATVSRTFRHPELVAKKTRDKVLAVAEELNFSISRSATIFQTGQSFRIALLLNDQFASWFNSRIFEGLDSVFHPAGYDLSVYPIASQNDRRSFFSTLPVRRNADAVIVPSFNIDLGEAERLRSTGIPLIGINALPADAFTLSIAIDDKQAMRLVVRHLISLGHRRITFFRVKHDSDSSLKFSASQRAQGFLDECRDNGIAPLVLDVVEDDSRVDQALTQLLTLPDMPTAICCQQDSLAVPLIFKLQQYGYEVPRDISVTGFDDTYYARQIGLTTVRQQPRTMGAIAAKRIISLLEGNDVETKHEVLPVQLMFRTTTAPARRLADD
ncbi:substrate-binding domain-containing protein [Bifidobacterium aerophilum]|uniref:LacI family DNA-binding transcriptional regulator n=1 Tax=Bifidobacterium aerophilum TaxID=1798155 RepID=A0A6N9Z6D9_9BIFI|nr:LacI family DNA-binding transcriptional regulator [Bifidobacterium aerophilum]